MDTRDIADIAVSVYMDVRKFNEARASVPAITVDDVLNDPMNYTDNDFKIVRDAAAAIIGGCDLFVPGTFLDTRDGSTYKTITIGNIELFAEDLHYRDPKHSGSYAAINDHTILYKDVAIARAIPDGWANPPHEILLELRKYFGGANHAGKFFKDRRVGINPSASGYISTMQANNGSINTEGWGDTAMWWGDKESVFKMNSFNDLITFESGAKILYASIRCARYIGEE